MSAVVVGVGVVSPLAIGVAQTFEALVAGRSAIGPIRRFDASAYPVTFAAQGPDGVDPLTGALAHDAPGLERAWLESCLQQALGDVSLVGIAPERIGVFLGSEAARPDFRTLAAAVLGHRPSSRDEVDDHAPWAPTRWLARRVGALGATATLSTACTSSGQSVGEAVLALRRGEVDVAIAGGVDVLVHPLMVTGFSRLGALSTRNDAPGAASRPFDMDRDGFVLGEGAGLLVLARPEVAERCGPRLGQVLGYGCSSNAWRITDSPPDGRGALQAMAAALADTSLNPDDIAYINAHGTSTRQNDISEARGIQRALGAAVERVPVSSTKSSMGHLVAACGAVEAIMTLWSLRERVAPPTLNLERPDPLCALHHVPLQARALGSGRAGLTNAFGFGGANATLVLEAS